MIVNENRLKKFLSEIIIDCESCPLYKPLNDYTLCDKYNELTSPYSLPADCFKGILAWLQEMDVAEALEAGAHIVNDKAIFPPKEIPLQPDYGVPCETHHCEGLVGTLCCDCPFDPFDGSCPYR